MEASKALLASKEEFLERSRELGREHADKLLNDCDDYGELTLIIDRGYIEEIPESIEEEVFSEEAVEDFGGVPDKDAFLEGLNEALRERRDDILRFMVGL